MLRATALSMILANVYAKGPPPGCTMLTTQYGHVHSSTPGGYATTAYQSPMDLPVTMYEQCWLIKPTVATQVCAELGAPATHA